MGTSYMYVSKVTHILLFRDGTLGLLHQRAWDATPNFRKKPMESTIAPLVEEKERLAVLAMRNDHHGAKHVMRFDGFHFAPSGPAIREQAADFLFSHVPLVIPKLSILFIQAFRPGGGGAVGIGTARGVFDVKTAHLRVVSSRLVGESRRERAVIHCKPWLRSRGRAERLCLCTSSWRAQACSPSSQRCEPARQCLFHRSWSFR
jgi:hypothetical protein